MRRAGFTVLELLVASLLLTMLVTVLTMIFNQSSIAWRTGVAGVHDLSLVRRSLGTYHDIEDDALPGLGKSGDSHEIKYRTVSIFANWSGSGSPQTRTGRLYEEIVFDGGVSSFGEGDVLNPQRRDVSGGNNKSKGAFVVGVRSAGPDKDFNKAADNISTYPEEVN